MNIKPVTPENREKVVEILNREWGSPIVSRETAHDPAGLLGFIAVSKTNLHFIFGIHNLKKLKKRIHPHMHIGIL